MELFKINFHQGVNRVRPFTWLRLINRSYLYLPLCTRVMFLDDKKKNYLSLTPHKLFIRRLQHVKVTLIHWPVLQRKYCLPYHTLKFINYLNLEGGLVEQVLRIR